MPPGHLHAVELRQPEVEHDRVGLEHARLLERGLAVAGHAHVVALLVEGAAKHAGDVGVVLDDEHTRASRSCRPMVGRVRRVSAVELQALWPSRQAPEASSPARDGRGAARARAARARAAPLGPDRPRRWSRSRPSSPASSTSAGPAARWARRWPTAILFMFGGVGYRRRSRCSPPGALIVCGRCCRRSTRSRPARLCLVGRAHARPGGRLARARPGRHAARRLPRRRTTCEHHGGLVGESLFWASAKLFSDGRLAHPVRLPAARRRPAAHRRLDRGVVTGHARGGRHHHASACGAPAPRATARIPYEPLPPIEPPEPEDREPVVRATHVEVPVQDGPSAIRPVRRADEPEPEPEDEPETRAGARAGAGRSARSPSERAGAHADGQPALGGHRVRRHRLPLPKLVLPEALQRRPEDRHEGHRAGRRAARGGAQPLQRGGAPDRDRRPART